MTGLGVITGLLSETECLALLPADRRPPFRCAGASAVRAAEAARALLSQGCRGLLSFGVAGGLAPGLAAGSVVIADFIVAGGGKRYATDEGWRVRLGLAVGPKMDATVAPIAGSDRPLASAAEKSALHRLTGAAAVDMESHGVAAVAAEAGVPFMALRIVADPEWRRVPSWVMNAVGSDGRILYRSVVAGVLRRPWQVPSLIALAGDSRKAHAALRRVAALGFSFPGLALP